MRFTTAFAAALATTTTLVLTAPAASAAAPSAAGTCSIQPPAQVAIRGMGAIPVRTAGDCLLAGATYAAWGGFVAGRGRQARLVFQNTSNTLWGLSDSGPLGRWTWQPESARDAAGNPVGQNVAYTDVRVGSSARLIATRSGARVTLSASATRYSGSYHYFIPWAGATGQLQWKIRGSSTWHALAGVKTNSAGKYTYSRNWGAALEYRVYFPATPYIWNAVTPTVYR